jgi:hypothetical protein
MSFCHARSWLGIVATPARPATAACCAARMFGHCCMPRPQSSMTRKGSAGCRSFARQSSIIARSWHA